MMTRRRTAENIRRRKVGRIVAIVGKRGKTVSALDTAPSIARAGNEAKVRQVSRGEGRGKPPHTLAGFVPALEARVQLPATVGGREQSLRGQAGRQDRKKKSARHHGALSPFSSSNKATDGDHLARRKRRGRPHCVWKQTPALSGASAVDAQSR